MPIFLGLEKFSKRPGLDIRWTSGLGMIPMIQWGPRILSKSRIENDPNEGLPSGKRLHNYGKSPFLMGKLTINDQNQ